ncbi:MAG: glycosyltransferase family 39 protein [Anaerolineae bacterium]|nr:glycosyltransferase family 39 protein [Anaerolineae bacterium]
MTFRWRNFLFVLVFLLATGLRFYMLDAQSFWNDEGNTARLVERPVALILDGAAGDIHPPGYYLLLHNWRALVGESEFALRSFSVLCGILTVAFTAAIGYRAGGWGTALGSSLWVALHPLSIYYSQEARMYALLGFTSVLTLWSAIRFVEGRDSANQRLTAYGLRLILSLSIALGLYTQYIYALVLLGLNLAFVLYWFIWRPGDWRLVWQWTLAHLLGGLLFIPWASIALGAMGWRPPDLSTEHALQSMSRALLVGITLPADSGHYVLPLAAILLLLALSTRPWRKFAAWAVTCVALCPLLSIMALGMYRPAYLKFLIVSVAPLAVVFALPLRMQGRAGGQRSERVKEQGSRRAGERKNPFSFPRSLAPLLLCSLASLGVLLAQVEALRHLYTDPAYARDDYRAIAAHITAEERQGDAILLSAPNQWEVFTYYYRGPLPVYPAPYRPTLDEATLWVDEIIAQHNRLFVVFWGDTESDPERHIEPLLAQRAYKAGDAWISTVRLAYYGVSEGSDVGDTQSDPLTITPEINLEVLFDESIYLEGYTLGASPFALSPSSYIPGDILPLALFWRVRASPGERLKVFVHLLNTDGNLVSQVDIEPGGGFSLTDTWQAGEYHRDHYGVYLPASIPPGTYTLWVGLYRFSGERLLAFQNGIRQGDAVYLQEIVIQ